MRKNGIVNEINGYISQDTMHLNVENLHEFNNLIEEIKAKEKELNNLINKLAKFDLKIKLSVSTSD